MPSPEAQVRLDPLFYRAFEIAVGAGLDTSGVHFRAGLARLAQQAGAAVEHASLVDDWIAAQDRFLQEGCPDDPEKLADQQKLIELDRAARARVLDGDLQGAERIYLSAENLRDEHEQTGQLGAHCTILTWLLETGDLQAGVAFFRSTNWRASPVYVHMGRRVMEAFSKAGQRLAGMDLLRNLQPVPGMHDAHLTSHVLGQLLWALDETDNGLALIRDAAQASVARAAADVGVPLWGYRSCEPISMAQLQCTLADREGAAATLNGVLQLAVPIEYDPPRPRPADLDPSRIWFAGSSLKPASERWLSSLPDLTRVLAYADLDEAAFKLVTSVQTGHLRLLGEVIRGQARRGAFEEAFRTLDRMSMANLSEVNEPSQVTFKPNGTLTVFTQTVPTRPVESMERVGATQDGLHCIRRYAARSGAADAFHRTGHLLQNPAKAGVPFPADYLHLELLVRQGQAHEALDEVSRITEPYQQLQALSTVMGCVVKARVGPTRDEILRSA